MEDDDLALLFELFENTPRQGPGSVATTRRALAMLPRSLRIGRVLDLGCGTGGSTRVLAEETGAQVTAIDLHPPFLARLRREAGAQGLADRIAPVAADMASLPLSEGAFDLIWSEGSAYAIGFEKALRRWRPLLRPGGCLVVSELVWFSAEPAERARAFFAAEYPDLRDEATRLEQARGAGYRVLGAFRLPPEDWRAYYAGFEQALREAVARHGERPLYAELRREQALYEACGDDYGYLCLVLQVGAAPGPR